MAEGSTVDTRFTLPSVIPPDQPLPYFHALRKLLDNSIETCR